MAKNRIPDERDRLVASLADSLPNSGGDYQVSSAFSSSARRRFLGVWTVVEHTVDGQAFVESFAASALHGATLMEPSYSATYDFREAICVKHMRVNGLIDLEDGRTEYSYRMSVAISWELGRGSLTVRPELGYQTTSLGGKPAAVKEFGSSGEKNRIRCRFDGEFLILEEAQDVKRLKRGIE